VIAEATKAIAIATIVMSIPLLLTYNLKYQIFPEGMPYFLLFFWWLLSMYLVPVLLVVGIVLTISLVRSSDVSRRALLRWNLPAISVGAVAEVIVVVVGRMPSNVSTLMSATWR
jgi:hypothetical protein